MKKLMMICFGIALALPMLAQSQDNSQQQSQPQQQTTQPSSQTSQPSQGGATDASGNTQMSGAVSKDGKTFTNSQNSRTYKVDNPDTLKGHEGDNVGILVHVDPDTNTIHIVQLVPPPQ
jgi:hypothetical protein